jgi:hypothetical protein
MTVRTRLAALAGVLVVGAGCAAATTGLATSALANTGAPSGVTAVDVAPGDVTELDGLAYAFPAGTGQTAAAPPASATAAHPATAARAGAPAPAAAVVNGPATRAVPMDVPVPGCTAANNNCGLPTCQASDAGCSLLNCVAIAGCTPGVNGLGSCAGTAAGGVLGCGAGSPVVNDCLLGLGCGRGGLALGGCGLFSLSGCGIDGFGSGLGFGHCGCGGRHQSGCGFFGGCGHQSGCGFFGGCGFDFGCGRSRDDDSSHRNSCNLLGFRDFRHLSFSSSHSSHGHDSEKH